MKERIGFLRAFAMLAAAALAVLAGCGGGSSSSSSTGTMSVSLTDAPACGYDNVYVTVEKVRVHQSSTAQDADSGWQEIVLDPARRIDLLTLSNGVLENLGQTTLPAGTYTQLRLVLAENTSAPWANAVVPTGGTETSLDTPSGQQSGLKINADLTVAADQTADFVLDFDACRSVVKAGASGRYNLKPVLSVVPLLGNAGQRVVGHLDPTTLGAETSVSLQSGGEVVKATAPDDTGRFVLYPVPAGTYALVVTSTAATTVVMTGVPVTDTAVTQVSSNSVPIVLAASAANNATGVVTLAGSTADTNATVRALQTISGGMVEVAGMPVDGESGAYTLGLPTAAPVTTPYVDNPTSFTYTADDAAAGKYTLEASITGQTSQTTAIDVSGGDVTTPFTF